MMSKFLENECLQPQSFIRYEKVEESSLLISQFQRPSYHYHFSKVSSSCLELRRETPSSSIRKQLRFAGMYAASSGVWTINCSELMNIHVGRSLPPIPKNKNMKQKIAIMLSLTILPIDSILSASSWLSYLQILQQSFVPNSTSMPQKLLKNSIPQNVTSIKSFESNAPMS